MNHHKTYPPTQLHPCSQNLSTRLSPSEIPHCRAPDTLMCQFLRIGGLGPSALLLWASRKTFHSAT